MRALVVVLALSGCCLGAPLSEEDRAEIAERRAAEDAERTASRARAPQRAASFARIASLIDPDAEVTRRPCPEAELQHARGNGFGRMEIATVDYSRLVGSTQARSADWRWLDDGFVEVIEIVGRDPSAAGDTRLAEVGRADRRYLAVFVAEDREMPRITRENGIIRTGEWDGGYFDGGLYVVDLDEGAVVCSAPLEVESSDEELEIDEDAITEDFQERMEEATDAALESITAHAKVNLVGIL